MAFCLTKRYAGLLLCLLLLGAGASAIGAWTLGFSSFTSYSYALKRTGSLPRMAPNLVFTDQFGRQGQLADLRGRYVLVHGFYASCRTVCPIILEQVRSLYVSVPALKRRRIVVVSVTVDPAHDTPAHLLDVWKDEGAYDGWIMARPSAQGLGPFARALGLWIFARRDGSINHSAYLFLVDPAGRIIHVMAPQTAVDMMRRDLEKYV
jgi:cytochrome oxidase Cu insertion factor (SCO1/SenC/PrrC family)